MSTKLNGSEQPATETTDAVSAGAASLTGMSEAAARTLSDELKPYGFGRATPTVITAWRDVSQTDILDVIEKWDNESNEAEDGRGLPAAQRTPVPEILKGLEEIDADMAGEASKWGAEAVADNHAEKDCPFPPDTALATIWLESFKASLAIAPSPALKAARERTDRAAELRAAIEDFQARMEVASARAREFKQAGEYHKGKVKSNAANYQDALAENDAASQGLENARNGVLPLKRTPLAGSSASSGGFLPGQRALPFGESLEVPDQDISSTPATPADVGLLISLDHLVKGDLQEYIPGTPEDMGVSNKQCESLKGVVGDTVGDLEKWQRENGGGQWWRKALKEKGVGLGGAAGDKVADAYDVIRRKYPMPSPGDEPTALPAAVETEAKPKTKAKAKPAADTQDVQAVKRLTALVKRALEISVACTDAGGAGFCSSVATEAGKIQTTIERTAEVTGPQLQAMDSWETAIEKWVHEDDFGGEMLEDDLPA